LNRIKQKEVVLFDISPKLSDYYNLIGENVTTQVVDMLISHGIEKISILESDKIQKFPITNCLERERNEALIGLTAKETILSKKVSRL